MLGVHKLGDPRRAPAAQPVAPQTTLGTATAGGPKLLNRLAFAALR